MATRHQRRKAAKVRAETRATAIARASLAYDRQVAMKARAIALKGRREPRNIGYESIRSCLDGIAGMSHRGYVCRG